MAPPKMPHNIRFCQVLGLPSFKPSKRAVIYRDFQRASTTRVVAPAQKRRATSGFVRFSRRRGFAGGKCTVIFRGFRARGTTGVVAAEQKCREVSGFIRLAGRAKLRQR